MLQDNWTHGGTNRVQHDADSVDANAESMAAARRDARASFAEFGAYLQSRGIDPATLDPRTRPGYQSPGAVDIASDAVGYALDRLLGVAPSGMWDRAGLSNDMRQQFNGATPVGSNPVPL